MPHQAGHRTMYLPVILFAILIGSGHLTAQQRTVPSEADKPLKIKTGDQPMHAAGTFEVTIKPVEASAIAQAAEIGRMTIDKTWSGDLTGTSKGEMLTGITSSTGSMAYVAMERVHATIAGHTGTFLFQHHATMQKDDPASSSLNIAVVENSGTDGLKGLTGTLAITITNGAHHYDFSYSLPGRQ